MAEANVHKGSFLERGPLRRAFPGQMLTGHTTSQAGDGSDGPRQNLEKTGAGSGPGAVAAADSSIFLLYCYTWIFFETGSCSITEGSHDSTM